MSREYLMENEAEIRRLEMKTEASVVEAFTVRAGLKPGMRVVDVACGAGVTTSILAGLVGESGSAVGLDASQERIEYARGRYGNSNTSFAVRDFLQPIDELGSFDFAWMRFALEYFKAESFDIVRTVSSMLSSGGILCLVDLDHNCLNHWGMSPRLETALTAAMGFLEKHANFDPYAGRKLYSHLYKLGYSDLTVELGAHHLIYGELKSVDEYNWIRKIEVLSGKLDTRLPGYADAGEFLDDFRSFFRDPGRFTYTPVISAWGRKPA